MVTPALVVRRCWSEIFEICDLLALQQVSALCPAGIACQHVSFSSSGVSHAPQANLHGESLALRRVAKIPMLLLKC